MLPREASENKGLQQIWTKGSILEDLKKKFIEQATLLLDDIKRTYGAESFETTKKFLDDYFKHVAPMSQISSLEETNGNLYLLCI